MTDSRKCPGLYIVFLIAALLCSQTPAAAADGCGSGLALGLIGLDGPSNPDYYVLENELVVENCSSEPATGVRLEVPLMADIDSPYQEVVKEVFSCQPMEIKRLDDGSRIGVFSIGSISPGSRTVLTQKYEIKLEGTNWLDDGRSRSIDCAGRYLEPSAKIECDDVRIRSLAWRLNPHGNLNKLDVARQAFGVTRSALTYSLDSPSANLGALAGLQAGSGCCEEYASLFVAMCRASDIPARIVNGYANGRDKLAADVKPVNLLGSRHQWAEFYLDGKGWIPVDPTLSNDEFSIFGQLPPGCYVAENYGDRQVSGKYQGGELAIQFQDRVARGY